MNEIPRITSAEPIIFGVLKIEWDDAFVDVVDVRAFLAESTVAEFIRVKPSTFFNVRVGEFGHGLEWSDDAGNEMDFGTLSLRKRAERQAALIALAS